MQIKQFCYGIFSRSKNVTMATGKFVNDRNQWVHKDPSSLTDGKRANYLDALKMFILDSQSMADDLSRLEYQSIDECEKRVKSRITQLRVHLDMLENNI